MKHPIFAIFNLARQGIFRQFSDNPQYLYKRGTILIRLLHKAVTKTIRKHEKKKKQASGNPPA